MVSQVPTLSSSPVLSLLLAQTGPPLIADFSHPVALPSGLAGLGEPEGLDARRGDSRTPSGPHLCFEPEWDWGRKAIEGTQDALRYDFRVPSLSA